MPQPYPRALPRRPSALRTPGATGSSWLPLVAYLKPTAESRRTDARHSNAVASLPSQQRVSVCNLYTIYWLLLFLLLHINAYSPCMLLALAIHSICT